MIVRRNTKAFKTIVDIVTACEARPDRDKFIRLYITKAGHAIADRISVEGIEQETDVFYDLTFAAVVANLSSANHQLHQSDEVPGIYFFHSTNNKVWDENPFEFDERITSEFTTLPELPATRKKEKPIKPPQQPKKVVKNGKNKTVARKKQKETKPADAPMRLAKPEKIRQPAYKLKQKILFTNLDAVIEKRSGITKQDILDYYYSVAHHLLPYLNDRPQLVRIWSARGATHEYRNTDDFEHEQMDELPDWFSGPTTLHGKSKPGTLLCNSKEQLLYYIENGCREFYPEHASIKTPDHPDYCLISIEAAEDAFHQVIAVAQIARQVLNGLRLTAWLKTDGVAALHIYIALDARSTFMASKELALNICKLIRLKIPDAVVIKDAEGQSYRKVVLNHLLNEAQEVVIAPYSLAPNATTVATPLLWDELTTDLHPEQFTLKTIPARLKDVGDPFVKLFKKSINAGKQVQHIESNYAFLF